MDDFFPSPMSSILALPDDYFLMDVEEAPEVVDEEEVVVVEGPVVIPPVPAKTIREIPTYVLIPMKGRLDLTRSVVEALEREKAESKKAYETILLFDNGSSDADVKVLTEWERAKRITLFERPDSTIYQMWNEGWDWAVEMAGGDEVNLAILNNDILMPPQFIETMSTYLRKDSNLWMVYPDYGRRVSEGSIPSTVTYTKGTYRHGGMCGWAFMVKAEARRHGLPAIDEQFIWWAGDDDLTFAIEKSGFRVGRINGLPVDHIGQATALTEKLALARDADMLRCKKKWGA